MWSDAHHLYGLGHGFIIWMVSTTPLRSKGSFTHHFVSTTVTQQQTDSDEPIFFTAPEDCAAHSLSKEDLEGEHEVSDEEWKAKNEQEPEVAATSVTHCQLTISLANSRYIT